MKTPLSAATVVVPAFLLGALGDILFQDAPIGLNLSLWIGAACLGWLWLRFRAGAMVTRDERLLLGAIATLAVALLWRDNEMLHLLDGLGIATCVVLLPLAADAGERSLALRLRATEAAQAVFRQGLRFAAGPLPGLVAATRDRQDRPSMIPVAALVRGTLFTTPLLFIFGGLLTKADGAYGTFLRSFVHWDVEPLLQHSLIVVGWTWLAAAVLTGALLLRRLPPVANFPSLMGVLGDLGPVEIAMVLGTVNLLFAGFIAFQLPHFFGGAAEIARVADLTYAENARGGFFELVAVAALVLPLLLLVETLVRTGSAGALRLYRWMASLQVALVLAIMASAIHRMALYQQVFGLTTDRFFASAFIAGLAVTCCWFVATVLRGSGERFLGGSIVAWGAWLLLLNLANPDQIIVETNVARAVAGATIDADYLDELSLDAVPAIMEHRDQLPAAARRSLPVIFAARASVADGDIRGWQVSRARARALLTQHSAH